MISKPSKVIPASNFVSVFLFKTGKFKTTDQKPAKPKYKNSKHGDERWLAGGRAHTAAVPNVPEFKIGLLTFVHDYFLVFWKFMKTSSQEDSL
jgi:hypothetical protein